MSKPQFSETQYFIGYLRELLPTFPYRYLIYAPSTREEKQYASDIVIKHFKIRYRYSEYYQFKTSRYLNNRTFSDLHGKVLIDTSVTPKYSFKVYNSKKTKQFNVLQKLAAKPRKRVYYCAPLFHTVAEFNHHFTHRTILNNSKLMDLSQNALQSVRIPLGSTHKIIFDRTTTHICSDPLEISGVIASDRIIGYDEGQISEQFSLESEIKELYNWSLGLIREEFDSNFEAPSMNLFEVRDLLLTYFNINWVPIFDQNA